MSLDVNFQLSTENAIYTTTKNGRKYKIKMPFYTDRECNTYERAYGTHKKKEEKPVSKFY